MFLTPLGKLAEDHKTSGNCKGSGRSREDLIYAVLQSSDFCFYLCKITHLAGKLKKTVSEILNPVSSNLFNQKTEIMKQQNFHFGLLILRLTLGILMILHGYSKIINGVGGIENNLIEKGLPGFIAYGVYVGEVIAPLMMIVGFRTRLAALIFAFNMVVAAVLAHPSQIFALTERGIYALETLALFLFGGLALVFTGGGKFAVSSKSWWD